MLATDPETGTHANSFDDTLQDAEEHEPSVQHSKKQLTKEQELNQVWKRTLANLFNYQTGGVLWYATAIAASGWVGHVYSLVMVSCSLVSAFMLSELLAKFPSVATYGALCNAVLSSHWSTNALQRARNIMDTVVNLEMFLYLCSVIVTLAQSLVHVAPVLAGWPAIVLTTSALLPTTVLRDFTGAAQLSLLGITATAVNIALLVYVCFAGDRGTSLADPDPDLQVVTDVRHSVASLGLYCIAYTVQSSLPSITFNIRQASLKHGEGPDQIRPRIRSIAYCSLLPTFLFNTLFSSAAYMVYGPNQDILPVNFRAPIISIIACSWVVLAYYSKGPRLLFILSDSLGKKVILNASKDMAAEKIGSIAAPPGPVIELNAATGTDTTMTSSDSIHERTVHQDRHSSDIETSSDLSADECSMNSPGTDIPLEHQSPSTANYSISTQTYPNQDFVQESNQESTMESTMEPTLESTLEQPQQQPSPVVATTLTFKYAAPAVTIEERPYRQVVAIRIGLLVLASIVAFVSPSLVGLMTVGGTILATCTMFVIPAFLLAADRGWINSSLFDMANGGIPAVTAGLVDPSRRHKFYIYGYKLFVFLVTPALVALSIMATYSALLIY